MGCDIHAVLERKVEDKWEPVINLPEGAELDDFRNYDTFAVLADVRNGSGFAGCDTGDGIPIISEPRGFPKDMSMETTLWANEHNDWCHSESFLTLQEMLAFDWDQPITKRGVIGVNHYWDWKKSGEVCPNSWAGGMSGYKTVILDERIFDYEVATKWDKEKPTREEFIATIDSMVELMQPLMKDHHFSFAVKAEWIMPISGLCQFFVNKLEKLKEIDKPENLRMIFCFDN